jgi:enoyl-CoA hydratase/carnithine racemase
VAAEMVLLGRPVGAHRALQLGLINEVADDPLPAARALAQDLARQPPAAVRAAKGLLRRQDDSLAQRIDREAEIFAAALATPEFQARAMAVLGKGAR